MNSAAPRGSQIDRNDNCHFEMPLLKIRTYSDKFPGTRPQQMAQNQRRSREVFQIFGIKTAGDRLPLAICGAVSLPAS
jgi:hypothetical protein